MCVWSRVCVCGVVTCVCGHTCVLVCHGVYLCAGRARECECDGERMCVCLRARASHSLTRLVCGLEFVRVRA